MKKLLGFFAACLISCAAKSQTDTPDYRLLSDSLFAYFQKTNKEDNLLERINQATEAFFVPGNRWLTRTLLGYSRSMNITVDSVGELMYDSLLMRFINDHAWEDNREFLSANEAFYRYYNSRLCPCIAEKIREAEHGILQEKDAQACSAELATDTGYVNTIRRLAGDKTFNEIMEIATRAPNYSLQHCPAFRDYFLKANRYTYFEPYLYHFNRVHLYTEEKILSLHRIGKKELLGQVFPGYAKAEKDIRQVEQLVSQGYILGFHQHKGLTNGQCSFSVTIYRFVKGKAVLKGQVQYVVEELMPDAPVLSFRYTPAEKMPDRKTVQSVLDALEESGISLPPPPMETPPGVEIIKEVRIDTMRRKN